MQKGVLSRNTANMRGGEQPFFRAESSDGFPRHAIEGTSTADKLITYPSQKLYFAAVFSNLSVVHVSHQQAAEVEIRCGCEFFFIGKFY